MSLAVDVRPARRNFWVAAGLAVVIVALLWAIPARDALNRPLPLSMLLGVALGVVFQRARFCFWCNFNDYLSEGDARGLLSILTALATGTVAYAAVLHGWVPDPFAGRLPPDAFIGPVGVPLALGAFCFGVGMAISGSCISAHLYRLGEGSVGSVLVLLGVGAGFILGFLLWNPLYMAVGAGQVVWLPALLGHGGALAVALAGFAVLAFVVLRFARPQPSVAPVTPVQAIFSVRWPPVLAGVLVGLIGILAYLRVAPLGVTAEIGSLARTFATDSGWVPQRLLALDTLRGCIAVVKETLASRNGVFVVGLVLGAAVAAQLAGQFRPVWPRVASLPRFLAGGVLLGFGAMIALGCTVGVLLSGTMAGALSGWVFLLFCLLGAWAGRALRPWLP
ncbi:inner membrane protein yeeE [Ketogulonicigenium robustum]|uniref:Inner membrane protein yeeE n=1 Tax=Ketogulonicigenium robustum TaxID=92947 RepID=A0A1W6NWC5_9RHOB|nr:YeeE/YedE family protein [Ketogulonicigenium robustum]ARO13443.1 inner membrane protein yeeE [Ketogulonicigenium robustum]